MDLPKSFETQYSKELRRKKAESLKVGAIKSKRSKPGIAKLLILVLIMLLPLSFYAGFLYSDNSKTVSEQKNAESRFENPAEAVKDLILITESDEPAVARINNVDNLKNSNPKFYKDAKNGDFVLVYESRVILYDADENRIINIAPIISNSDIE